MQNHRLFQAPADSSLEASLRRELRRSNEIEQHRLRLYREIEVEDRDFADFLTAAGQDELMEFYSPPEVASLESARQPAAASATGATPWSPAPYALRS